MPVDVVGIGTQFNMGKARQNAIHTPQLGRQPKFQGESPSTPPGKQISHSFAGKALRSLLIAGTFLSGPAAPLLIPQRASAAISARSQAVQDHFTRHIQVQWNGKWVPYNSVPANQRKDLTRDGVKWNWDKLSIGDYNDLVIGARTMAKAGDPDFLPVVIKILQDAPHQVAIPHSEPAANVASFDFVGEIINAAGKVQYTDETLKTSAVFKGENVTVAALKNKIDTLLADYETSKIVDVPVSGRKANTYFVERQFVAGTGPLSVIARAAREELSAPIYTARFETLYVQNHGQGDELKAKRNAAFARLKNTSTKHAPSAELVTALLKEIYGEDAKIDSGAPAIAEPGKKAKPNDYSDIVGPLNGQTKSTGITPLEDSSELPSTVKAPGLPYDYKEKLGDIASRIEFLADRYDVLPEKTQKLLLPAITQIFLDQKPGGSGSYYSYGASSFAFADPPAEEVGMAGGPSGRNPALSPEKTNTLRLLKSLAKIAAKGDKDAFKVLRLYTGTKPAEVYVPLSKAQFGLRGYDLQEETGRAIRDAFNTDRAQAAEILRDLALKKAPQLWVTDKYTYKEENANQAKEEGRRFAITAMASDYKGRFLDILKPISENPDDALHKVAMAGRVLAQDKTAIPYLLSVNARQNAPERERLEGIFSVLQITGPAMVDPIVMDQVDNVLPLSMMQGRHFFQAGPNGEFTFNLEATPSTNRLDREMRKWFANDNKVRDYYKRLAKEGKDVKPLPALTPEQRLLVFQHIWHKVFGTENPVLNTLAADQTFAAQYLSPLVAELEGLKSTDPAKKGRSLDRNPNLDLAIMDLIGKSGIGLQKTAEGKALAKTAGETLADMVQNPVNYAPVSDTGTFFEDLMFNAFAPQIYRLVALENLGSTLKADDPRMDTLTRHVQRSDQMFFVTAALNGLKRLGEQDMDAATRARHVSELIKSFDTLSAGRRFEYQPTWFKDVLGHRRAVATLQLGGDEAKRQLLARAESIEKTPGHPQKHLLRTIAQALDYVGGTPVSGYEQDLIKRYTREKISGPDLLSELHQRHGKGDGATVVMMDIPFAKPVGDLKGKIEYPSRESGLYLPHWPDNWEEVDHATATTTSVNRIAPGVKRYLSYNANAPVMIQDPYESFISQDAMAGGFEDLLIHQIRPKNHPQRTDAITGNTSLGYLGAVNASPFFREVLLDRLGGYAEALGVDVPNGEPGMVWSVSAGNEQDSGPLSLYDPSGSVNTLLSRAKSGEEGHRRPQDVQIVSAQDPINKTVTDFSSMGNPAKPDDQQDLAGDLIGGHGYRHPTAWRDENGVWNTKTPLEGTSFSAPESTGFITLARAKYPKATVSQIDTALHETKKPLPGDWKVWEGGSEYQPSSFIDHVGAAVNAADKEVKLPDDVFAP